MARSAAVCERKGQRRRKNRRDRPRQVYPFSPWRSLGVAPAVNNGGTVPCGSGRFGVRSFYGTLLLRQHGRVKLHVFLKAADTKSGFFAPQKRAV